MAVTLFFSALFGRPLAATIDLRVELMTKMTNPWGARVREIMREMERDREGEQETKTNLHNKGLQPHTNTHCTVFPHGSQWWSAAYFGLKRLLLRRDATFMQHKAVISFGFRGSWREAGMECLALTGAAIPTAWFSHQPDKSCLLEPQKTQDRAESVIPTWH